MQEKAVLEISKSETQPKAKEVAPPSADSRAFAEEVIQKIEAQIKEEEALQAKDELGAITNSVGLGEESQTIAEKLNVKSEFNSLNEEAKTLQTGTIQKINNIVQTKEFNQIADALPFVGGAKQITESFSGKKLSGEELSGIERVTHGVKGAVDLGLDLTGIGEVEKGAKLVHVGEKIVSGIAENPEAVTNLGSKIVVGKESNQDSNQFSKQYHHPDYRSNIAKSIIEARKSGDNGVQILNEFHEKTDAEKNNLESQEKERDIRNLMEKQDLLFLHALPLEATNNAAGTGTQMNNENISAEKYQKMGFGETFEIVAGLSPTISVSIPSPDSDSANNHLFRRQGIILGEGRILTAKKGDSGSVAFGLDKRIAKYDNEEHKHSAIQPELGDLRDLGNESKKYGYNELTVEKPEIAGMYYDMSFKPMDGNDPGVESYSPDFSVREKKAQEINQNRKEIQERELLAMRKNAEKYKVPLYILKNENGELKKYAVSFGEGKHSEEYLKKLKWGFTDDMIPDEIKALKYEYQLTPVTTEQILNSEHKFSSQEKVAMVKELQEKDIFADKLKGDVEKKLTGLEKTGNVA